MPITRFARGYHERMFPGYQSDLLGTDPEFIERFDNFAFDETVHQGDLDAPTRFMSILATLIGCQGIDEFEAMIPAALNFGLSPIQLKEVVCQAAANMRIGNDKGLLIAIISQNVPFIGYPRSRNALKCVRQATDERTERPLTGPAVPTSSTSATA
ncbi:carboxymuconolactone decarboxylase family protein [Bifidobacterium xylocopae]|uniref:carboxymuconolactone decarboxylase family protein n=1 Tax=Bifidobacterium xylocopae TaxID=2493119 RepID=UPI000DE966A6|nr:carboxymuconolactone decarboxylase family protein [Bifidobacterium xylocopae]